MRIELGHSVKEAIENINRADGAGNMSKTTAYEWFSDFKKNHIKIRDEKLSERSRDIKKAAVVNDVGDRWLQFSW
ncbi:hypothetical protein DdX_06198 [Ditylenchus destructor]|uniref:Mos1 transposase HTH domain-containing protein n=1 Tax=Ditylenchus destructor TaxID=166010 RepID=A0AAD4NBX9_9BILA|nr:hypothetical protein DdX_06198 [Ditylenchus destructor]